MQDAIVGAGIPAGALNELEALYREVDDAVSACGVACWLRGQCCNFAVADHRLYASSLEIAYVREKHAEPFAAGSVLCPFWKEGLCVERERRPLACRTYFCDPAYRVATEALYERFHGRIREIADRYGIDYRYEPFVAALRTGVRT